MDEKWCNVGFHKLPISLFLKDSTAPTDSRIYSSCYRCREKAAQRRKSKRSITDDHDLNEAITALERPARSINTPPPRILPLESLPIQISPQRPSPIHRPDSFLPPSEWNIVQDFYRQLKNIQMETCSRCNERWFDMKLKDNICYKCFLRDKGSPACFLMSTANQMDPGDVPAHLPALTQVEEMLIARCHVQMLLKRYRGHQYHYTGHCVTFLQDIVKIVTVLSNLPQELDIILLQPSTRALGDPRYKRQFQHDFRVRKSYIITWLVFLKAHNRDYRDITIDTGRLAALPDDGDVSTAIISIIVPDNEPELELQSDSIEYELLHFNTQSSVPNTAETSTEIDLLLQELIGHHQTYYALPAPSIRRTPIDEIAGTERLFTMAFPTLYPTGHADLNTPRCRSVTLLEYAAHFMRYKDGRFGRHPRWRFLVFNMHMRLKASKSARYFVSKTSGLKDLDRDELQQALLTDHALLPHIVRQGSTLIGTRPFWRQKGSSL